MRSKASYWFNFLSNFSMGTFVEFLFPHLIKLKQCQNPWATSRVVQDYASNISLFKPEEVILRKIKSVLPTMRMLDVGVGAGRTTTHFAPLSLRYVGIDFSAKMIEVCKTKFKENKEWRFKVADARNLSAFSNESFDFVLFSFNGLDCIPGGQRDRQEALQEIRRLVSDGGYFCFSTHNMGYVSKLFQVGSFGLNEIRRIIFMRLYNSQSWKNFRKQNVDITQVTVNSVGDNFIVPIRVESFKMQLDELYELGYKKIIVFDLQGNQVDLSVIDKDGKSSFFYFLCQT